MKITVQYKKNSKPMTRDLSSGMKKVADYLLSSAQRKISAGIAPPNSAVTVAVKGGNKTLRDRGILWNSLTRKSSSNSAEASSNLPYARILQEGGTISAKKAKSLAIPASARTRTLMRQFGATPRECIEGMKNAGYSVWSKGSAIMAKKGSRGVPFVLFGLRKSVKIPSRPYLHIDDQDEILILSMLNKSLGIGK